MGVQNQAVSELCKVKAFHGCAVFSGVVHVSDDDMMKHLDSQYDEVIICNIAIKAGKALYSSAPLVFSNLKVEYTKYLQDELHSQLRDDNDVDIDWHE